MSAYDERPWLARYAPGQGADLVPEFPDAVSMFRHAAAARPHGVAIHYFDGALTLAQLDEESDAFAAALAALGVGPGDRVALYLQNVPQFVVTLLAAWKLGAVAVPVNPMNRQRELAVLLADSGSTVLVCLEHLYPVARDVLAGTAVEHVVTTSELDYQLRHDARLFSSVTRARHEGTLDFVELIETHAGGSRAPGPRLAPTDTALLTYTSGTTGAPKGAMNTHGNVVFASQFYRDWMGITGEDLVLGVAPLFHITGLTAGIGVCLLAGVPLVLAYRFDAGVVLDAIRERRPTFTVGAITVFIALLDAPGMRRDDWGSFRVLMSGGAPVSPATVERFRDATGCTIHNIYGLTESTGPSHATPVGAAGPVDPVSKALSVGVPVPGTVVRIVGEDDGELPPGEVGEIVIEGPNVVAGYWGRPDETAHALPGGALHTGDVGFMDTDGWFFVVDRKKDQINASGYKVWPREVEDVLYEHPAVREAAVVGVPDEYRGETVKAVVSLLAGATVEPAELVQFCKERLAAYKYPRVVEIVDELPKTATGKILRRELR